MKAFPHHQEWISALDCLTTDAPHLLIICPPGHGKTFWLGVFNPAFQIGRNPDLHVGYISNSAPQAQKQSIAIRDTILTPEYQAVFPDLKPDYGKGWSKNTWYVKRQDSGDKDPTFLAAGLFGPVLGSRFDLLILDDVFDEETANSETLTKRARAWVRRTAMTRLKPGAHAVCIMTRWNEEDLAAEFLNDKEWTVVHMPAIGYWGKNTALWPEWVSLEKLLPIKLRDPISFEGIYQGNPSVPEGQIIKRDWWQWANRDSFPSMDSLDMIVQAWDTAFKTGEDNDYSVCITAGRFQGNIYILDVLRRKMEWPELLRESRRLYKHHRPRAVLIEDAASGQSLLQSLRLDVQPMIPVIPSRRGDSDTEAFVKSKTSWIQGRRVWLPKGVEWTQTFVNECASFPKGKDDQVLALAHLLKYVTAGIDSPPLDDTMFVQGARQFDTGNEDYIRVESGGSGECAFISGRDFTESWQTPWRN